MKLRETDQEVVVEAEGAARACVIWLHGLGADGHDFVPIVPELGLDPALGVRFVFPHAPVRPVTINNGLPMRAWYDILSLGDLRRQDEAGVRDSQARVAAVLAREEAAGIPRSRIVLAGFSQGGAITLHSGLRTPGLAGLMALSTYLPLAEQLGETAPGREQPPILMCHGEYDPVLPMVLGEASCEALRGHGCTVDWRAYPMQHQVCEEQIADMASWLRARLA
jgi:phospholipase/carboxylesterase